MASMSNLSATGICPETPIEGRHLAELAGLMASYWDDSELRDLDLSMALNIPPNRISHFKHAKSSVKKPAKAGAKQVEVAANHHIPMVHPPQAILIRLLMRYPQYANLIPRPSNSEVWELIAPLLPGSGPIRAREIPEGADGIQKKGFGPVFGRAAISSYKMLPTDPSIMGETSLAVVRLQMLIMSRFADIFRDCYRRYCAEHMFSVDRKDPLYESSARDWSILRERDSLTGWMTDKLLARFWTEVQGYWRGWFESHYLPVLRSEAISRNKDPDDVLVKGNWTNSKPVTDAEFLHAATDAQPITGSLNDRFSLFLKENNKLTSAEMFWVLGMQVKTFYRYRSRENIRIDAPTSILIRYLAQHPNDLDYFVEMPPSGKWLLSKVQAIDPTFKLFHLSPLFGSTKMSSYKFAAETDSCPHFARRLACIFARELPHEPRIYWQIRECVEDEVRARGLNAKTFWQQGKWNG
jgi:hypothetical protein